MVKTKKSRQHKTTVKLRKKHNSSGTKSLYLDIHLHGRRLPKEYLNIILEGGERSPENKEKLRIAEAARIARENQLVVQKLGLPEDIIERQADTYAFIRQKSIHLKSDKHVYLIAKLKAFSSKDVLPLSSIDKAFCMGFQDYLRSTLGQGTAHAMMYSFSSYLNRAYEAELIKENPIRRIPTQERLKKKKSTPQFLTMEEIELLANKSEGIHPQVKLSFLFSCFTGMRWSDLSHLQYHQITEQVIEGKKVKILCYQQQKTGEITQVPLNEQAEEVLRQRKEIAQEQSLYVFPQLVSEDLNPRSRYHWADQILKKWAIQAALNRRLHYHLGRHTFATLTITYGGDLYTASKLLGHSNINSTQIYAHVVSSPKLRAMEKFSEAIRRNKENKEKGAGEAA